MIRLPGHLPQLSGRALTAFRILWLVTFALALAGAAWSATGLIERNRAYNVASYSLGVLSTGHDRRRHLSPLSPAITAQGLVPDSLLLAVDGRIWPKQTNYDEVTRLTTSLGGPEGTQHTLALRDPAGRNYKVTLFVRRANLAAFDARAAMPMEQRFTLYRWSGLVQALLVLAGSAVLFLRRPGDPVVALLSLGLITGPALGAAAITGNGALVDATAMFEVSGLLIGTGILAFPAGRFQPRWSAFLLLPIVAISVPSLMPSESFGVAVLAVTATGLIAAIWFRYRRLGSLIERQQIKWASLGFGVGMVFLVIGSTLSLLQQSIGDPSMNVVLALLNPLVAILAIGSMVGGLLISLLRFRLYDAETALSRSALYGGLALAMIAVFAGTEKLVELLAEQYFGESIGAASGAIAAGIAAAIIPLFHRRLEHWAERRFQGPLLALRDKLPNDLGDWRETAELSELARDALERVMAALRSHGGAIVVPGASELVLASHELDPADLVTWLGARDPAAAELDRDDHLLPLRIALGHLPERGPAFLLLGPRPDGTMPGKDEREAARAVADPLARALAVTVRRTARDHTLHTTLADLAARLARLEVRSASDDASQHSVCVLEPESGQ